LGFHNFTLPRHSKIKSVQPGQTNISKSWLKSS